MEVGQRLPILTVYLVSLLAIGLCEPKPLSGKIIPGIYVEEKPPVVSYEKAVPLVFEFKLKSELWNINFLSAGRMRVLQRLACRSDNKTAIPPSTSDWSFTCPVFYHMYNYLRQFKVNYSDIHPTSRTLVRPIPEKQFFSNPDIVFDDCDAYLMRKWTGISNRDTGFEDYKSAIENCNPVASYVEDQIQDYAYDINPTFEQMRDNFVSNFATNLSTVNTAGEIVNNLIGLQGIQLFNTYAEITRFREAVLSCQKQLIPLSFIGATRLDKAMTVIRTQLLKSQYALAMSSISKLYKMPIADCIYGTSMILVRILLPIEKKITSYKLLKVHYPQFLYKTHPNSNETLHELCQVVPVDSSVGSPPEFFLYDRASDSLLPTECRPHNTKLCHIPDKGNRPLANKCIYSVLRSSFDGIRRYCMLKCDREILSLPEFKQNTLPLIKRVNPSRFIITLNRITSILIKCDGLPDEMVMFQNYGAVEVTLSCNCHIAYHTDLFYPKYPCGNQLHLTHIIPDHMTNSNLSQSQVDKDFFHIDVNKIVNLTLKTKNSFTDLANSQQINSDVLIHCGDHRENNHNYMLLWIFLSCQLFILSMCILFLYLKIHSLRKGLEYSRGAVCFSVSQMTSLDDDK